MLNPRNSPACLHSLVSSKMDVMHIIEVKLCITSENIREVTAELVVVEVSVEIVPIFGLLEEIRDFY